MKKVRQLLAVSLVSLSLLSPTLLATQVHADGEGSQSGTLKCINEDVDPTVGCDLAISEQVSVNDGTFASSESVTNPTAVQVGNTVNWLITVSNNSFEDLNPEGTITVTVTLPAGVNLTNSVASYGTFTDNAWTFTLDPYSNTLPITLNLTTTATATGEYSAVAQFTGYAPCNWQNPCEDPPYSDYISTNNSDTAYINIAAAPVVTPTPTPTPTPPATTTPKTTVVGTPNTGFGVSLTNVKSSVLPYLIGTASVIGLAGYLRRLAFKRTTR